ncbi:MAG TPA: hypothetical protein PK611_06245 [Saprospiraceae bacterium]|nr:hypothetical protein [Saprospiraceae bacterium]HRO09208.1 hypothetical protein [Saprospiraceae bacterium]HRO73250.1 hypothetical protein [Saprospiraceae bacterium]HRP42498.1 hypothetical protein [Saprospiraceae bacterium]
MKNLFTIILSLCFVSLIFGQKKVVRECTSMLERGAVTEMVNVTHYIFTGQDTTGLHVKVEKIKVTEPRQEVVKKLNKDCTSPNPQDCMVETIVDVPAVTMNLYTLSGPDVTSEYETRIEKVEKVTMDGGLIRTKIVCEKNRTPKLINKVQEALILEGYPLTVNGKLDQATKLSLTDFQKHNKLAYGDLTLEVLAALNIK